MGKILWFFRDKEGGCFICDEVGQSDTLEVDTFSTDKYAMTNIVFHVRGLKDSLIVIGAHYDAVGYSNHKPLTGADENLSGVVVLLDLVKMLPGDPLTLYSILTSVFLTVKRLDCMG